MLSLRKTLWFAISAPHSVAAKSVNFCCPFCSDATERVLFMKKTFFPRLKVHDICPLGLLIAITALLSIFCTFRLGSVAKIPLKFISVFLTAILYGPIFGGLVAAIGDILNCLLAPSGPIIPQITVIEFISGLGFGLCFLKTPSNRTDYFVRVIIAAFLQLFIDMVITTSVFSLWLGWYPTFWAGFAIRTPAGALKLILNIVVLMAIYPLSITLRQLKEGTKRNG